MSFSVLPFNRSAEIFSDWGAADSEYRSVLHSEQKCWVFSRSRRTHSQIPERAKSTWGFC